MAVIGTVGGTFLAPGVSGNRRLYTPELIAGAVQRMRTRIASDEGLPITMLSHHAAGDDTKELTGRVTSVELQPDGSATWEGTVIDTDAGKAILSAIEPDDQGRRVLDSVSIRGAWLGPIKTVSYEGQTVTTGTGLEIDGIDWTKSPGVSAARLSTSARAAESTAERSPIYEEAPMTVAPIDPAPVADAVAALEAFVKVSGYAGPADVRVDTFVPNADVATAGKKVIDAFQAAMKVLDPSGGDGDDMGGDLDIDDLTLFQNDGKEPSAMETDDSTTETTDETTAETTESVSESGGGETTETTGAESGETTENTQVTGLSESQLADVIEKATAAVLARWDETHPATEAAPAAALDESAIKEAAAAAAQTAVGEAIESLTATITTKLAETKDQLRDDIVKAYGPPSRAGLIAAAETTLEKPTHEMTREEFDRFASERLAAVFGGVTPRHPGA